jgi:hypothetical protein
MPKTLTLAEAQALRALATNVLVRQRALKAAKAELQALGFRASHLPHRELTLRAEACLAAHRAEFVGEALRVVAQWEREGRFGKCSRLRNFVQADGH